MFDAIPDLLKDHNLTIHRPRYPVKARGLRIKHPRLLIKLLRLLPEDLPVRPHGLVHDLLASTPTLHS